jgi:nicotinamidase-related amidase
MTSSQTVRNPLEDHLLTPSNAALLIIDFQPVQVSSIASMDRRMLVANIFAVARTAKLFGLPVVLSTVNVATGINTPTMLGGSGLPRRRQGDRPQEARDGCSVDRGLPRVSCARCLG